MEWNEHSQFSLVKSHFPVLTADLFFIVTQFLTVYLSSATQTHPHLSLLVMCPHLLLLDIIEFKPHSFLATCGTFWNCWTLLNMTCFSVWCWKLPNFAYFILFPFNVHHLLPLNKNYCSMVWNHHAGSASWGILVHPWFPCCLMSKLVANPQFSDTPKIIL